ncbi:transmembrane protein 154 [Dendropsophus ebraccatus]|uniref:transmembrane protein 154 n=1 Tax=Dendropsophus ebraccatus TaxID=150705 RepID=UPI0038313951
MDETTPEGGLLTSQTPVLTSHEERTLSPATPDAFNETDSEVTESPEVFGSDVISILIYAAPAIILLLLIPVIILIVWHKKRKKQQEGVPDDEEVDVKSPIFEEDTPSVMEIEMDDLDKWMNTMKSSCRLSTLEEEGNKIHTSAEI